ncbi:HNH endonuclease [Haloarcula onubensis]|uniref:HNH endonuclease n=1 Tax=Haloarcula onubensis TaxID=2950539 RepID=A0ABU2FLQ8_9EURY|nr:HNH endonuclease [Halomicroarcula sp. S3CR25-11]MDS0281167.1 HNH endonuclease [Halomicroarcula sp. S3CR25-11]
MDCPTCGKSLNTEQGMRQHHTKVHGDPLPNRACEECETGFYDPKARRTYCEDCYTEAGESNGNWKGAKEEAECRLCGDAFEYYASDKAGVYCLECVENADEFLGTPSYANRDFPRTERECERCEVAFSVLDSTLQRDPCRFCSQECLYDWMSNELYEGTRPENAYRGKWWSIRRAARQRDDCECQICGMDEDDLGRKPDVHHITPLRKFENPQDAHKLDDVITLCPLCHRNVETSEMACPQPATE